MGISKIKPTKSRYVLFQKQLLDSELWEKIGHVGRDFYTELKRNYNGYNNGELICSYRFMRKRYKYGFRLVSNAIKLLVESELIEITQKGEMEGLDGKKTNMFRLVGKHEKIIPGKT